MNLRQLILLRDKWSQQVSNFLDYYGISSEETRFSRNSPVIVKDESPRSKGAMPNVISNVPSTASPSSPKTEMLMVPELDSYKYNTEFSLIKRLNSPYEFIVFVAMSYILIYTLGMGN